MAVTTWTCSRCHERIAISVDARNAGKRDGHAVATITFPPAALADVYGHMWAHDEDES